MLLLLRECHGMDREEVPQAVSRLLGFQATSQQLRDRIATQVDALIAGGDVVMEGDVLVAR